MSLHKQKSQLTQKRLKEVLNYNPETGDFTWKVTRSHNAIAGEIAGFIDSLGYRTISINKKQYRAHRLAILYMTGDFPKNEVDHVNGNRSDNRFENIRECSHSENNQNKTLQSNNTSGLMGVYWNKKANKWHSAISSNGKRKYLGLFDRKEDAYEAYLKARSVEQKFQPIPRDNRS